MSVRTPGISQRFESPDEQQRSAFDSRLINLRVAIPGIVESFDPATQTASVQPAITENVLLGQGFPEPMALPLLTDVPVQFPGGGGFHLTFPVNKGDECLLVFADMCIDGWWQSSGVQNQMEKRRHDLSDAMALMGFSSVPNAVRDPSGDSIALRNRDNTTRLEVRESGITIVGNVSIEGNVSVTGVVSSGSE